MWTPFEPKERLKKTKTPPLSRRKRNRLKRRMFLVLALVILSSGCVYSFSVVFEQMQRGLYGEEFVCFAIEGREGDFASFRIMDKPYLIKLGGFLKLLPQ